MSNQVRPEHQHPPSGYVKLFTSAASDGPLKLEDQEDSTDLQLETAIENGSDGPIIALLLPRLPNLKQLTYINWGDSSWFLNVLEQAAAAHATSNPPLAFRNLTSVRLEHWDTEMCIDYRFMRYLICMPSMRFLSGHMIGGERGESENPVNLARSRVTGLEFSYSALSRDAMSETLSGIEALEKFSYECGGAVVYYTDYDPHGMLADLLKYAGHSLEELSLVDCEQSEAVSALSSQTTYSVEYTLMYCKEETSPHTFLVEFQKLKHLDLDWDTLVPDPDAEAEDVGEKDKALSQGFYTAENTAGNQGVNLADFLPPSLESLKLAECPVTGLDLLVKMLEQKEARLPKLSKMRIGMTGYEYVDMLKLAEAAETAGVDYGQWRRS